MTMENTHTNNRKEILNSRLWRAVMFYGALLVLLLGVLLVMRSAMTPLRSWLEQYQTAQYQNTSDEIYDLLFADPDWALLYDMAGIEDTKFEGRDEYVAYMEATVGEDPLACVEMPTGLSAHRRFSIRHAGEEIASFTMVPAEKNEGDFDRWTLGTVEVYFTRTQSVTVTLPPDCAVYINKVPLDDSYTTLSVSTAVEEYLDEELHGYRYQQQTVTGLLVAPEVIVLDAYGRPVSLTQDPETGHYAAPIPTSQPITDEEYERVLAAAKADALFSLRLISISELRQHFDPSGLAYNDLTMIDIEPIAVTEWQFDEESIRIFDYYRYSDDLFSVHVQLTLDVTDDTGAVQSFQTDVSYFFRPNSAGSYMVSERYKVDLQQQITQVRLTYRQGETILESSLVDTHAATLTPPEVEGVIGWGKMESDGSLSPVLQLQEDGTFCLIPGQALEPMTLYPIVEGP